MKEKYCQYCCDSIVPQSEYIEREEGYYHTDCFEYVVEEERYKPA